MIFSFPDTEKMEQRYAVFEGGVGRRLRPPGLAIRRRRIEFNYELAREFERLLWVEPWAQRRNSLCK